ncbi:MAG: phage tail sheath subtilisin-like domain-containing protein [Bryobacteraceae bacterium]
MLSLWSQFDAHVGKPGPDSYLAYAVRGFFENGGQRCYVVPLEDNSFNSLHDGLEAIKSLNTVDLVLAPDLVRDRAAAFELQQVVVNHCESMGDRFAILDSQFGASSDQVWEQWSETDGKNGAIYYPWIKVKHFGDAMAHVVPPCGHIAGVYARTDRFRGVHKAPANEILEGVLDLERHLTDADQGYLNPKRINCLRSFPGRGIRVWGARTLSGQDAWTYVNVRRLFLTAVRWIEWNMQDVVFEPNNPTLWARIERELSTYFIGQYRAGALKGRTPQEAFFVKCDAETNPPDLRNSGRVVTEIGLASTIPFEFVVVRLIHGAKGVTIDGPAGPDQMYQGE